MASFFGILHRPASALAAVAVATASSALPDHVSPHPMRSESNAMPATLSAPHLKPIVHRISISNISGLSLESADKNLSYHFLNSVFNKAPFPIVSPPFLITPYQHRKLAYTQNSVKFPQSDVMYQWHLPDLKAYGVMGNNSCSKAKSQTVVVLLGWLGAKQKHLKKYADWYTLRGFHVITFTLPMADIVSYKVGGKVEQNIESLAEHLVDWVSEENYKNLVFHTFSNTGWLMYGALLEKFQNDDPSVIRKIKGCIVDSAPVATPDPQVWASGFSAAILKKHSLATKGTVSSRLEPKPTITEIALLAVLEKLFGVVLNFPAINRRLSDVLELLTSKQPRCPQLYIYSSADRVIPAKSVESFIERLRRAGHEVRACDFLSSPHVDHFRSHPGLYSWQLANFLDDCALCCCRESS